MLLKELNEAKWRGPDRRRKANNQRREAASDTENIIRQLGQLVVKYKRMDNDLVKTKGRRALEDAQEKLIYAMDILNS